MRMEKIYSYKYDHTKVRTSHHHVTQLVFKFSQKSNDFAIIFYIVIEPWYHIVKLKKPEFDKNRISDR